MKIRVKRGQLAYFRTLARKTDNEIAAYLVGTLDSPERVTVKQISIASEEDCATQSPTEVSFDSSFFDRVRAEGEAKNWSIVGHLHSHPNWWPVKSKADHVMQVTEALRIVGVCAVMRPRTQVYFWVPESSLPATIEYY